MRNHPAGQVCPGPRRSQRLAVGGGAWLSFPQTRPARHGAASRRFVPGGTFETNRGHLRWAGYHGPSPCGGVSFVVHGEQDGLVIEGNTVREDVGAAGGGCWGIAVDTGYSEGELLRNVVIRGDRVINVGNVGIGLNACDNCLVENNVVVHEQSFNGRRIAVPDRDRGSDELAMTDVTIRNNSVLDLWSMPDLQP